MSDKDPREAWDKALLDCWQKYLSVGHYPNLLPQTMYKGGSQISSRPPTPAVRVFDDNGMYCISGSAPLEVNVDATGVRIPIEDVNPKLLTPQGRFELATGIKAPEPKPKETPAKARRRIRDFFKSLGEPEGWSK